jgi:DNA-binding winged helix-turn-helix (wHTH) protein/TolB-like protein/Tfp pilus assembly protein PilF
MVTDPKQLRQFGNFRLDPQKKVLWHDDEPVNLPLKEVELLCVLTENVGEVVTKEELLNKLWADSFVEESNLSRHIYLLRKTFKDFGGSEELIQTVPRRGYRFAGEIREPHPGELVIEKHSLSRTLIEEVGETALPLPRPALTRSRLLAFVGVLLAVITSGVAVWRYNRPNPSSTAGIKSIAVLPVKSFSGVAGNDKELGLRITDALITNLGSLQPVSVRPTSAVLAYAETDENPIDIGRELEVDAVLEGRMQSEGNRVRITFQLLSVKDGTQIWAGQFDGETNKILSLQDTISQAFVAQLKNKSLFGQQSTLAKNLTENPEAYENFLQGRYFVNQRIISYDESLRKARPYFERAIELDPNFAGAIAGLADVVNLQTDSASSSFKRLDEGYTKGRELALKALALDPSLAEGYAALGWIQQRYDWNYTEAEKSLKKAIELKPNLTNAYLWLSINYGIQGKTDGALEYAKKATEFDPTSPAAIERLAAVYSQRGDCDKMLEILPRLTQYLTVMTRRNALLGERLSHCGRCSEAIPLLEEAKTEAEKQGNRSPRVNTTLGFCYVLTNQTAKAREALKILEEKKETGYSMYGRILIHANLGEKTTALNILSESWQTRDVRLTRLKSDPRLKVIHSEPRFLEIMRKMNLE